MAHDVKNIRIQGIYKKFWVKHFLACMYYDFNLGSRNKVMKYPYVVCNACVKYHPNLSNIGKVLA